MADKTIPELVELTTIDENTLFLADSGIQSHKVKARTIMAGVMLYNAAVTYGLGQTVADSGGILYVSQAAGNIGNALTDTTKWLPRNLTTKFFQNGTFTAPVGANRALLVAHTPQKPDVGSVIMDVHGRTFTMGSNNNGQLGVGDTTARSTPTLVSGGLTFKTVSKNGGWCVGLTTGGDLYTWGINTNGHLAVGDVIPRSTPTLVLGGFKFSTYVRPMDGADNTCFGLTPAGDLYGWGINPSGVLGVGDVTPRSSPVLVLGGLKFDKVYAGDTTMFAITKAGDCYAWGRNTVGGFGILGVGDAIPHSSPILVLGGIKFQSLALLNDCQIGLSTGGDLYGWGTNANGQLGVGDVAVRSSPTLVLGGLKFVKLFESCFQGTNFFALTATGAAYAWGGNAQGSLGVGDSIPRSSPVLVLGGLTFTKILSANNPFTATPFAVGLTTSGDLYAWGENTDGQLGVGDVVSRSSPTLVLGGLKWVHMWQAGGSSGSMYGLTSTGLVYGWGRNTTGDLGLGDIIARSSPVLVLGGLVHKQLETVTSKVVPVVAGTSYPVEVMPFKSTFNYDPIAEACDLVEVHTS